MSQNSITQSGVGKPANHRKMNGAHNFSAIHAEDRETQNPIARGIDQGFHESTCFRQCARSQVGGHRNFGQSIRRSTRPGFGFV